MATMSAPASARYGAALRDTPFKPTAPIPIPNLRRVTDPPPRSPTRYFESSESDFIFEMSPHVANETPLTQQRDPPPLFKHTSTAYARKPLTFSTVKVKSPSTDRPPYWEEPFLYSVPRLPPRAPLQHSRTQSARVNVSGSIGDEENQSSQAPSSYPSSSSLRSLSHNGQAIAHDPRVAKAVQDSVHLLTAAFQQSFSSTTSFTQSFQTPVSPHVQFKESLSPPTSVRAWNTPPRSARQSPSRHRRATTKSSAISGVIRTTAAEPVVSFAQAELKHSPSSGVITRVVKVTRTTPTNSLRAKSPYPVVRGRRSSARRDQAARFSDEGPADSLDKGQASEKFGLEKFLLRPFPKPKGPALDENVFTDDENIERGRTRSRVRGGRRA